MVEERSRMELWIDVWAPSNQEVGVEEQDAGGYAASISFDRLPRERRWDGFTLPCV